MPGLGGSIEGAVEGARAAVAVAEGRRTRRHRTSRPSWPWLAEVAHGGGGRRVYAVEEVPRHERVPGWCGMKDVAAGARRSWPGRWRPGEREGGGAET